MNEGADSIDIPILLKKTLTHEEFLLGYNRIRQTCMRT